MWPDPVQPMGSISDFPMNTSTKSVPSNSLWKPVMELIERIISATPNYNCVYRGETECFGEVSSGLYREYRDLVNSGVPFRAIEEEETRQAAAYIKAEVSDGNEIEILSSVQHYGGKTNLVDFTTDFNIALLFACDGSYTKDGRILVLERTDTERQKFYTPGRPPDRASVQKSVFVHPTDGLVAGHTQVLVPSAMKVAALDYLEIWPETSILAKQSFSCRRLSMKQSVL